MSWPYAYIRKSLPEETARKFEQTVKNVTISRYKDWQDNKMVLCFSRPLTQREQTVANLMLGEYIEAE